MRGSLITSAMRPSMPKPPHNHQRHLDDLPTRIYFTSVLPPAVKTHICVKAEAELFRLPELRISARGSLRQAELGPTPFKEGYPQVFFQSLDLKAHSRLGKMEVRVAAVMLCR